MEYTPADQSTDAAGPSGTGRASLRMLIVEDDPGIASLVMDLLAEDLEQRFDDPLVLPTVADAVTALQGMQHAEVSIDDALRSADDGAEEDSVRGFDCVLLDLGLPDSDGIETVQAIVEAAPDLPVVVLSAREDAGMSVDIIRAGAQDFVPKRFNDGDRLRRSVIHAVERKKAEIKLRRRAYRDTLTGLLNHAAVYDAIGRSLAAARRRDRQVSVLYVDIDHFKQLNDTYGHVVGDAILVEVAKRLQSVVRDTDAVGRLGGDEFALVTSDAPFSPTVGALLPRVKALFNRPFEIAGQEIEVSASVGASFQPAGDHDTTVEELVEQADRAMYKAKRRFA